MPHRLRALPLVAGAAGLSVLALVAAHLGGARGPTATSTAAADWPPIPTAPSPNGIVHIASDRGAGEEHERREPPGELDYASRYEEWFAARAYPNGTINWKTYDASRTAIRAALSPTTHERPTNGGAGDLVFGGGGGGGGGGGLGGIDDIAVPALGWEHIGPRNLQTHGQYGEGLPPLGGRVNDVAFDPHDPDDTYYAAASSGGLWKTVDGGNNWYPLSEDWDDLYTTAVALSPGTPGRVYVGTGDYPGGLGVGLGIMVSDDGGNTWDQRAFNIEKRRVSDIEIDPDNEYVLVSTGLVYSNRPSYVYRSTDDGQTFPISLGESVQWSDLAISVASSTGARYYYAAGTKNGDSHIWRSRDRGESWMRLTSPVQSSQSQLAITTSTVDWRTVYLLTPQSSGAKVWKSTDAGQSWDDITGDLPLDEIYWYQSFYNYGLHCFRRELVGGPEDALLLANTDAVIGDDSGDWLSVGGPTYSNNAVMHVDVHNFATHPTNPDISLACSDGGVYRFDYIPGFNDGVMTSLNRTLCTHLVNRLSVHPSDIDFLMGGTQDNGTPIATGQTGTWFNIVAGDTGHTAINQKFPWLQYAAEPHLHRNDDNDVRIIRTDDYWNMGSGSFLETNVGGDQLRHGAPIAIDPNFTNLIYFCSNYLYRYDELSGMWENRVGGQKLSVNGHVRTFDIAPSNSVRIYTGSNEGEVWMSPDMGSTWEQIDDGLLPDATIGSISVDPTSSKRVLVSFEGSWSVQFDDGLYECENTDANPRVWTKRTGTGLIGQGRLPRVPINVIARHPSSPKTHWFVGTDYGVWGTDDEGETWFDMTRPLGMPVVPVTDLKVTKSPRMLFASTFGRGFWRLKLKPVVGTQITIGP